MENGRGLTKGGVNLNVCRYCKCSIDDYSRTIDHVVPKSMGGNLGNKNKVPSCKKCNEMKSNQNPDEFIKTIESMLFFETMQHKEKISYLRRVRYNVKELINERRK